MESRAWTHSSPYGHHGSNFPSVGGDLHASGHRGGHVAAQRLLFLGPVCEGAASCRAQKRPRAGIRPDGAQTEWPRTWREAKEESGGRLVRHQRQRARSLGCGQIRAVRKSCAHLPITSFYNKIIRLTRLCTSYHLSLCTMKHRRLNHLLEEVHKTSRTAVGSVTTTQPDGRTAHHKIKCFYFECFWGWKIWAHPTISVVLFSKHLVLQKSICSAVMADQILVWRT